MRHYLVTALVFWIWTSTPSEQTRSASQQEQPSRPDRRFCKAEPGYRWEFPRDHFSHPCFRTEWWYFTGNLRTAQGREFGYELTFFREGLNNPYPNPSRWRVDDLFLAHFAITDLGAKKFFYSQRLHRAGIELAGADASAGRVWNGDWSAELRGAVWTLAASEDNRRISLQLDPRKPAVLQGKNGYSQKASGESNASYYYSLTRLETSGEMHLDGVTYALSGWSWMDHEFATNQLQRDQIGWDWVSLHMDDGTEWMFYQLRRANGQADPYSSATFISAEGKVTQLVASEFQMQPLSIWRSPASGAEYPIRWRIHAPQLTTDLDISTIMPEQELNTKDTTGVVYWEGSIVAQGTREGKSVGGRGYLELTGYAGPLSWLYPDEK